MASACSVRLWLPAMVAALFTSLFCVRANATPMFMGLGDLPGGLFSSHATGVSAGGSVVVGESFGEKALGRPGGEVFRWTRADGMVGPGDPRAISADGLTIAGNGTNPSGEKEAWIAVFPGPAAIEIDIKPTTNLNPINPMSRGVIPVATLGSETFDAADVDVSTLAFGPARAMPLDIVCEDDLEDDDDDDRHECDRERGDRRHRHRGHPDDHGKWNDNDRKRHDRHHQFHGKRHGDRRHWSEGDGNKHRDRRRHRGDRHRHREHDDDDCEATPFVEDVNDDGHVDLVSHYRTLETGIGVGNTEACLTGKALDGTAIAGCDVVDVAPLRCTALLDPLAAIACDEITPQLSWLFDAFEDLAAATTPGQPAERAALVEVAEMVVNAFNYLDSQSSDGVLVLDALAYSLAQEVNAQHRAGRGLVDDTANNFFALDTDGAVAGSAAEIRVEEAILANPSNVAAGGSPGPAASGDTTNAAALARLRDVLVPARTLDNAFAARTGAR